MTDRRGAAFPMIDTHVHLVTADEVRYPRAVKPRFVTDSYTLEPTDLMEAMDRAGVEKAIAVQPFGVYGTDSQFQADAAAAHPDRLIAVCGVESDESGSVLLRHWVLDRGMRGGRISTLAAGFDPEDPWFVRLAAVHGELGVPMSLLTSRKYLDQIATAARRAPATAFVVDHLGIPGDVPPAATALERLAALLECPNVYFKVSTALLLAPDGSELLAGLVAASGADRVVWGSNFPVTDHGGYASTVESCRAVLDTLPAKQRDQVACASAQALWPELAAIRSVQSQLDDRSDRDLRT